ncbi:MAG: hypothetical protein AAF967_01910 [Pseudomonadota bacterium]
MTTYVRIYATEGGANNAVARLGRAGFSKSNIFLPSLAAGKESDTVHAAVEDGTLPEAQSKICIRSLKEGRSLVSVQAPFGRGKAALASLESADTVYSDKLSRYTTDDDPAPFSELLGLPVLSNVESSTQLLNSDWSFSSIFGIRLLSKNPTPLSSLLGLPVLLKPKRNWNWSFGLPLLINNATPLSSLFGIPTLIKTDKDWKTSFGVPLLMNDPAPLSNLFGWKTIIKD